MVRSLAGSYLRIMTLGTVLALAGSTGLAPRSAVALTRRAAELGHAGAQDRARRAYLRALTVDAEYTPARLGLARTCDVMGDREQAVHHYRLALMHLDGHSRVRREVQERLAALENQAQ